ncbi:ATP-binding cassette sub-family G member 2-like [Labeo rohita]|uniref:ATP-binding cassette sub-family G member 2-like n=1 Tax=Labeo rohita TaxID=84645 RepID=A0A498L8P8_LABRO|nr:ATP-binding cassette sub-family G member 2-like [Labeo rohita]
MELIIDPPVLFLDEPTTGLDASTANSVLMLLKRMANSGRTIILSIHQPRYSIYRLFDSLTLLVGGRMVYHGPAQVALNYFSQIELDQEQLSLSLKGIEDRLVEEYKNSINYKRTKSELKRIIKGQDYSTRPKSRTVTYSTSFCHQFHWVFKRTIKNLMLNPQTSVAQVGVMILLALVVGAIFFGVKENSSGIQNRMGALFFISSNQCFSTMSSAELFIIERKLFVHEYISGYYRVSVYFLSKVLSDVLFLRTIPGIIFSCVIYWMIGLKATAEAFFIFLFSIVLVSYAATSMTLAISADQTVVTIANIFINNIFVLMMIFSGLLVNLPSVADWLNWLKYLSIPRYGLAAVEINEFTSLIFCDTRNTSGIEKRVCSTGEGFLNEQGVDYSTWGLWQNHLALGIMTLIFLIITYLKLRFIKKFT